MLFLAERKLDDAVVGHVAQAQHAFVVLLARVVYLDRAALDVPAYFAVGTAKTCRDECRQDADTGFKVTSGNLDRRQTLGGLALLECLARGFSRFVFLGESDDKGTRGSERRKGFRAAMKVAGLPADRLLDIAPPPVSMPQGARALPEILQRWPDTDIIICVSDPCAFGVLTESQRRGISVPGELAIAGFGEFEVSGLAVPSITTVAVDAHAIGRNAGELILEIRAAEMRGGRLAPQRIEIHTAPVLREST